MKKILIISPVFLPKTSADMHRVRMLLPHLKNHNWEATIICANIDQINNPTDIELISLTPLDIRIVRYAPWSNRILRLIGLNSIALRSIIPLYKKTCELLKNENYELAYYSNTAFATWLIAPFLKKKFGLKYVLDYQDPWRSFESKYRAKFKYFHKSLLAKLIARIGEPIVYKQSIGITSVSEHYIKKLKTLYPDTSDKHTLFIPFASSKQDIELAREYVIKKNDNHQNKDNKNIVYIGRLGEDMQSTLQKLFKYLENFSKMHPEQAKKINFNFLGTSYNPQMKYKQAEETALKYEIYASVHENPARLPFIESISKMLLSDAILILDSDDLTYKPSKLFNALLCSKPTVAVLNDNSNLSNLIKEFNLPILALNDFNSNDIFNSLFDNTNSTHQLPKIAYSENMTADLTKFFNTILL